MQESKSVLLVDDEAAITRLFSTILIAEGFRVAEASSVAKALALITSARFDVLISDLNIGEPGDGFTVVSAMRRVQPEAVTMILTGYPAFETALRAIHAQADDFLLKPTSPKDLVRSVREHLGHRSKRPPVLTERLARILAQLKGAIVEEWYHEIEQDPAIRTIPLSREARIDHLPEVMDELVCERTSGSSKIESRSQNAAVKHGYTRHKQGYTLSLLLEEARILHHVIAQFTQRNLLRVDISKLVPDLIEIDDRIHWMLKYSVEAFSGATVDLPESASKPVAVQLNGG